MYWCNFFNPDLIGIQSGRIQIIDTYVDALNHARKYCENRKSDYRELIRSLAQAKGLGRRRFKIENSTKDSNQLYIFNAGLISDDEVDS